MDVTSNRVEEPSDDGRLEPQERSLYVIVAYFAVAWLVISIVSGRLLPDHIANALTGFLVVLGAWFVDPAKRTRFSLTKWVGVSLSAAAAVTLVGYGFARFWPAS